MPSIKQQHRSGIAAESSSSFGNPDSLKGAGRNPSPRSVVRNYIAYSTLILVSVFTIVYVGISATWHSYANKEQTRRNLHLVDAGLKTMEMFLRESAVTLAALETNAYITQNPGKARALTDSAIEQLKGALTSSGCARCEDDEKRIAELPSRLSAIRKQADHFLSIPADQHIGQQIGSLGRSIARLSPEIQAIVTHQISAARRSEMDLSAELTLLAFTGELYEHTYQLGLGILPALAKRRPSSPAEHVHSERELARIRELLESIELATLHRVDLQRLADATVRSPAYAQGLEHIAAVIEKLEQPAPPDTGTVEPNLQIDLAIAAITKFRDDLIAAILKNLDEQETLLKIQFILATFAVFALTLSLIWGLLGLWKWIVHPFGVANRIIRSFILEDASIQLPPPEKYRGLTRELFSTLSSLKEHIDFKRELESQQTELIQALQKLAETDHLTGLLNRRAFERCVAQYIEEWNDPKKLLAFILFDVDHFKEVNDSYGHMAGDMALVNIAKICRDNCRKSDITARVGGEEFCMVCFVNSPSEANGIAQRLRIDIQNSKIAYESGPLFRITASFGVAVSRLHEPCNTSILFGRADRLLYSAKAYGRNRVILHDGETII